MVLTVESVDETSKCDHSNESHCAVISFSALYYAVQGLQLVLTFESVE